MEKVRKQVIMARLVDKEKSESLPKGTGCSDGLQYSSAFCKNYAEEMAANQRSWWNRNFRPHYQPRQSTELWETADGFPTSSRPICPCSSCVSPRDSVSIFDDVGQPRFRDYFNERDALGRKFRGITPRGWFRGSRGPWNESSTAIPLTGDLAELDTLDVDLAAEHARITTELSAVRKLRRYHLDMMVSAQAYNDGVIAHILRGHERLKVQEGGLISQLDDIERGMDDVDTTNASETYEFSSFRHESILPDEIYPHNNQPNIFATPGVYSLNTYDDHLKDQNPISDLEAEKSLKQYNQKWLAIQERSNKHSLPPGGLNLIPWPTESPNFDHHHLDVEPPGTIPGELGKEELWKWNTYRFFCYLFGLIPIYHGQRETGDNFGFMFPETSTGRKEEISKVKRLRQQLKLEKVRWHEDRMTALFGAAAATDDRVKAVWGAIMDLRAKVDQELADTPDM